MSRRPQSAKKTNLSQFGLLNIPDINDDDEPLDLSDDDIDLEAELAAITGGGPPKPKSRKPAPAPVANLDAMIAESLKDIPSDDDGSGDDDDPDLLNELKALAIDDDEAPPPPPRTSRPAPPPPGSSLSTDSSTISLLQDRITNYTVAEKNAKSHGESSRARRFGRGLKTLQDLLKQAKSGKPIKNEDIPPPVMVGKPADSLQPATIAEDPQLPPLEPQPQVIEPLIDLGPPEPSPPLPNPPPPSPPSPSPPSPSLPEPSLPPPSPPDTSIPETSKNTEDYEKKRREMQTILDRQAEFKAAALAAKKRGDKFMALGYLKTTKQFDMVIEAHRSGQEMNMEELPTMEMITAALLQDKMQQESTQGSAAPASPAQDVGGGALITASSLGEGLEQRLEAFRKLEAKAQEEGNASKARRMHRIVKQYQEAIKNHQAGRPIAVEELPAPAGFGPLPTSKVATPAPTSSRADPSEPVPSGPSGGQASRQEAVLALLLKKQTQFKEAALYHKKKGEVDTAIQLLRNAKRFEPLIEATRAGKPVDLKNLPTPPKDMRGNKIPAPRKDDPSDIREKSTSIETSDEISGLDDGWVDVATVVGSPSTVDGFTYLLSQLESQAKLAKDYMQHSKKMGHLAEAKMYESLLGRVKEDLDILRVSKLNNRTIPKFHYVMREFSITQCNTDLGVNDLELTIVRGIGYHMPKVLDTFVKFEFPFPQEAPVSDRTEVFKCSNSPEYNAVFPLTINRTRACTRVFKRHGIKFEVWNKGGWFRSDVFIGSANVKLAPLQHEITIHDSFPLFDGRRAAGGSLEVKLRVRTPLVEQEIKTTKQRWLILDDVEMF